MMSSYSHRLALDGLPSREHRWAIVGCVLAVVLLALLVAVMNENIAEAKRTRESAELKLQERGRCNAMRDRLAREQCLLDLRLGEQAQMTAR